MSADLVTKLTEAATAAMENVRPSIEYPAGGVRGITVELTLTNSGHVHEAVAYVERRSKGSALLAQYAGGEPPR